MLNVVSLEMLSLNNFFEISVKKKKKERIFFVKMPPA